MAKNRIMVGFSISKITNEEWHQFKIKCLRIKKPVVEVLWKGGNEYLNKELKRLDK